MSPEPRRPEVGLCADCVHAVVQRTARHSEFWRCCAADHDPSLLKYPPLPVRACGAFENSAEDGPEDGTGGADGAGKAPAE